MALLYDELKHVDDRVKHYDQKIILKSKADERCQRLEKIAGVGPMIATAVSGLGDLSHMKNGRHFSAFLGLVPKQHSSGSTQRLLGISKRGDTYIRKLLIQGAHAVLIRLKYITELTPKYIWLKELVHRRGANRAAVALVNKNARIIWRLQTSDQIFNSSLAWKIAKWLNRKVMRPIIADGAPGEIIRIHPGCSPLRGRRFAPFKFCFPAKFVELLRSNISGNLSIGFVRGVLI